MRMQGKTSQFSIAELGKTSLGKHDSWDVFSRMSCVSKIDFEKVRVMGKLEKTYVWKAFLIEGI